MRFVSHGQQFESVALVLTLTEYELGSGKDRTVACTAAIVSFTWRNGICQSATNANSKRSHCVSFSRIL